MNDLIKMADASAAKTGMTLDMQPEVFTFSNGLGFGKNLHFFKGEKNTAGKIAKMYLNSKSAEEENNLRN